MGGEIDIDLGDAFGDDTTKNEVKKAKELAEKSGAPELVRPKQKEREKQFHLGKLPLSVIDSIDDVAAENRMNRKTFILKALKAQGVPIPDDLLRDRRRT